MRRQELSGSVQCSGRFVEHRRIGLEDVGHPRGDVERDLDVGGRGLSRKANGVGRPTCEARPAARKASDITYTPPWKYRTTWRGSIPSTVISAGWDTAQCGRGHGHVGGQRLRRYRLSEKSPLLVDIAADGKG
jgi:hypothetical protein